MSTVFKKELKAYFKTPFAYIIGAILLLVVGIYTIHWNLTDQISNFEYALNDASWILMVLIPLLTLRMHAMVHAKPIPKPLKGQPEPKKPLALLMTAQDIENNMAFDKAGISPLSRVLGLYFSSLLTLVVPILILILFPVILSIFGNVYLPSALGSIAAFLFLAAALDAVAVVFAVATPNQLLACLWTLLSIALIYVSEPVSVVCRTAFSAMLLFTVIIVLIGLALYLIFHSSTVALAVAAFLEVIQVIFFIVKHDAFTYLAPQIISRLSLFERFRVFTGGLLDLRAILYFILFAVVSISLAAAAAKAQLSPSAEGTKKVKPVAALILTVCAVLVFVGVDRLSGSSLVFDTTSTKLYRPAEQLSQEVEKTSDDIDLYWICEVGKEDASVRAALVYLDAMSPRLHVHRLTAASKDFITQYVVEDVYDNSIMMLDGSKYRFISFQDLYAQDYSNYDKTATYDLVFTLQDQVDHALEYFNGASQTTVYNVIDPDDDQVGVLSDYFNAILQKNDYHMIDLDLGQPVPQDAAVLLISGLTTDLNEEETANLKAFLDQGGSLFINSSLSLLDMEFPNLYGLLGQYGGTLVDGMIFESSSYYESEEAPYRFYPTIEDTDITSRLTQTHERMFLSVCQGLTLTPVDGVTQTPLLSTSDGSYSKPDGFEVINPTKEDSDISGPFTIAAAFEKKSTGTHIIWMPTTSLWNEGMNETSKGGNQDFILGALSWLAGSKAAHQTIPSTVYNYGAMRVNTDSTSRLSVIFAIAFPFLYLIIGIFFFLKGRQKMLLEEEAAEKAVRDKEDEARRQKHEEARLKREAHEEALKKAHEEEQSKAKMDRKNKKKRSYAPLMDQPAEDKSAEGNAEPSGTQETALDHAEDPGRNDQQPDDKA